MKRGIVGISCPVWLSISTSGGKFLLSLLTIPERHEEKGTGY